MSKQYTQNYVAMGSGSTATSNAFFVGDFRLLSVSVQSSASLGVPAAGQSIMIQGSNADGLRASDLGGPTSMLGWSNITSILPGSLNLAGSVGAGLFTFDPPGYRWVRSYCSPANVSVASVTTITFNGESW